MIDTLDLTSTLKKKKKNEIYVPQVEVTTLKPTKKEKESTYFVVVSKRHHVDLIYNDDSDFIDYRVNRLKSPQTSYHSNSSKVVGKSRGEHDIPSFDMGNDELLDSE
ncbi:Uncharacterized protein Fot_14484 [Forsythia ovata]|uniref:Uncharacterized protein n=1 Tax=Forsythia ovata TaxID=205694 RepID=A0ABD1W6G5_9LAMI